MRAQHVGKWGRGLILAGIAVTLTPTAAPAQIFGRSRCTTPCPPTECAAPQLPSAPPAETKTPAEQAVTPSPELPMQIAGVQGGLGVAYSSPNMFGDFFGTTSPYRLTFQLPPTQVTTVIPPPPPSTSMPPGPAQTIITTIPGRIVTLDVPLAGSIVERSKISEDNNPLPRDRVFFTYDYFNSVPLNGEVGVHNFVFGFEKTFCDQMASIEVRVPFASTLNPNIIESGSTNSTDGEVGDVHFTLKGLLWSTPCVNVAAGVGVSIPTGPDIKMALQDGTPLGRIRNDSVIVTPYIAYLLTPNDRCFFQNWFQIGFDANSDPVELNPALTTVSSPGRLKDQTVLSIDAQLGYWLYKSCDCNRWVTALAPFIELHYNTALDNANSIQTTAFSLQSITNRFDELNMSVGVIAKINDNCTLALGAAFPLRGEGNRSFDYQVGLRANIFFGPTARNPSRATFVP